MIAFFYDAACINEMNAVQTIYVAFIITSVLRRKHAACIDTAQTQLLTQRSEKILAPVLVCLGPFEYMLALGPFQYMLALGREQLM
jgi:hypothetical protein